MLPDARLRLSSTKIDFESDVGLTGQDHDNYPPAQGQARFDHMRMVIIALLANQASFEEPSEYREGTNWFDLNTLTMKIRRDGAWQHWSKAIVVAEDDTGVTTLADWYAAANASITAAAPDVVFSGTCTTDNTVLITIPGSLRASCFSDSRPLVFKNGLLIDPSSTRLEPGSNPTAVRLSTSTIDAGDRFTVIIRRIPETTFYSSSVTIP